MKSHSVHSSLALGIRTSVNHGIISNDNIRSTENEAVAREDRAHAKILNLCERHKLPDGMECGSRTEKNGFYFCPGSKEGCPLKG